MTWPAISSRFPCHPGRPFRSARHLPPLVAALVIAAGPLAGCGGDTSVVIVDGFGEADVSNEVDRLHTYGVGGTATLTIYGSALDEGTRARSDDDAVFQVVSQEVSAHEPLFFGATTYVLQVVVEGVGPGTAALQIERDGGETLDDRALTFVEVDRLELTRIRGLPDGVEPSLPLTPMVIGERGAELRISYGAGDLHGVQGRGLLSLVSATMAFVDRDQREQGLVHTDREILRIAPVREETHFDGVLGAGVDGVDGVDVPDLIIAVPGVPVDADFERKTALRDRFGDDEIPAELAAILATGDDDRVLCDDTRCAIRYQAVDAEGRPVLGAPVTWQVPQSEDLVEGDTLLFAPGGTRFTLRANVGALNDSIEVSLDPESVSAVYSTEAASCASLTPGSVSAVVVGLLLLGRPRRRRRQPR